MSGKMMLLWLLAGTMLIAPLAMASDADDWDRDLPGLLPVLSGFAQFNDQDAAAGLKLGLGFPRTGLAIMGVWHHRPFKKAVLQRVGPRLVYQLQETRGLVGIQVARKLSMGRGFYATVAGGMGYSYADYAGTNRKPDTGATAIFEAGLMRSWGPLGISAGYLFINWPDVPGHRAYTALNFWF